MQERRMMPTNTATVTRTLTVTTEEFSEVENYLRTYGFYRKLLRLDKYEQEYFGTQNQFPDVLDRSSEAALAHARMFDVRHFIMSMQNSDEKLFLYTHYVKGDSVEKCAELLGISRSSAFRLKKRALIVAADHYKANKKERLKT
jgi:DNA-directed RNA polymerase specialized sigma subunit